MARGSGGVARCWFLLFSLAAILAAQSKKPEDLATGKILVIPRDAPDRLFAEAVILLVQYNENGALGLMVNRRSTVPVASALRELKGAAGHSEPVFVGGPVELDTVFGLTREHPKPDGAMGVFGNVSLVTSRPALEKALSATSNPAEFRIYLGYCGWGPHQLDSEVRRGGWYIFDRSENLAFDPDPATLWSRLVAKAEQSIARATLLQPAR